MKSYSTLTAREKAGQLGLAVVSIGSLLLAGCAPVGASRSGTECGPLQNVAWSANQPNDPDTVGLTNLGDCAQPYDPATGLGEGSAIPKDGTFDAICLDMGHPERLKLAGGRVLNLTVYAEGQLNNVPACPAPTLPNS